MIKNLPEIILNANPFQQLLLLSFLVVFIIKICIEVLLFLRILWQKNNTTGSNNNSISLFITLRNEEKNIRENLPEILSKDEVDFEVIVVDDFSLDNSLSVLGTLKSNYPKLKVSSLNQETRFSEKLARNIAVKATQNEWLLQIPVSITEFQEQWLTHFIQKIDDNKSIIIGYSNVISDKGFYNRLYRIESFFRQVQSVGFIINGMPFVYFEENLAFKKEKYFEQGGFGKHMNEPYANMELVLNQFIRKKTTQLNLSREATIRKSVKIERSDYIDLLKKSYRIEKNLSLFKRFILHFNSLIKLIYFPLVVAVIILFTDVWQAVAVLVGMLVLKHLFIIKILQNRLNERKIFISSLVYDLIMPYFIVFYRLQFNRRSRNKKWRSNI